jgi:hypothetical protein
MDWIEKKVRVTAGIVKVGVKLLRESQRIQKETDFKFNALMDAQIRADERMRRYEETQRKNDERFNRLLDILSRTRRNGHS